MSENLQACIEEYILNDKHSYYDTRFGTVLDGDDLHPSYKQCFSAVVQPVYSINSVERFHDTFMLNIECDANQKIIKKITVNFYPSDNTFTCRDYDPSIIIPYILQNPIFEEYFRRNSHPYYRFGYVANYQYSPIDTYRRADLDVEVRYLSAMNELHEFDNWQPIRVQEPDTSSDCDSCGSPEIEYETDPQLSQSVDEPITMEEFQKMTKTWYGRFAPRMELPGMELSDVEQREMDALFGDEDPDEKIDFRRVPRLKKIRDLDTFLLPTRASTPEPSIISERIQQMRELQELLESMGEMPEISRDCIPTIPSREDNLDY